jgi:hypothetical protein
VLVEQLPLATEDHFDLSFEPEARLETHNEKCADARSMLDMIGVSYFGQREA